MLKQFNSNGQLIEYSYAPSKNRFVIRNTLSFSQILCKYFKLLQPLKLTQKFLLAKNYHKSTKDGYFYFVTWSIITSIFLTTSTIIGFEALFFAVLFTNQDSFLEAAAYWLIKDGLGQLGAMVAASFINTKYDANPRQWRFMAGFLLDVATLIDLMTLFRPDLFLLIASVGNVFKNIGWLSASASRAAIHQSFSLTDNLADLTAKSASQSILGSIIGTAGGVFAVPLLSRISNVDAPLQDTPELILTFVFLLVVVHLMLLYRSLDYVTVNSIDLCRLCMAIPNNASTKDIDISAGTSSGMGETLVLSPESVCLNLPIIRFEILFLKNRNRKYLSGKHFVQVGSCLRNLNDIKFPEYVLESVQDSAQQSCYVLSGQGITLLIKQGCTEIEVIECTIICILLVKHFAVELFENPFSSSAEFVRLVDHARALSIKYLRRLSLAGWECTDHFIESVPYRIQSM